MSTLFLAVSTPIFATNHRWQIHANSIVFISLIPLKGDYLNAEDNSIVNDLDWVSYKQHFFSSILISEKPFNNATIASLDLVKDEKKDSIFTKQFSLKTPLELSNGELNYSMKWYYGPSDYNQFKNYKGTDLGETADLGWGIFGTINRWIFIPIF